mgnify:CR=1 FL=1
MALLEMPFLDLTNPADGTGSLRAAAQNNILLRRWARAEDVQRLDLWRAQIYAIDDPLHLQWCWASMTHHAPAWENLSVSKLKEWMPLWLHFLQIPEAVWATTSNIELPRVEGDWIHHVRRIVHTLDAKPLYQHWESHGYSSNVFWKAAVTTFSTIPAIAESLQDVWLNELQQHRTDPSLLFLWVPMAAASVPSVPPIFNQWLQTLIQDDPPSARLLQLRQGCTTPAWLDAIYVHSMLGVFEQRHDHPQPPVHTNMHAVWNSIRHCSYEGRLIIAEALLRQPDLNNATARWPLNFQEMTRTVQDAAPHMDIRAWGTAPWLAGLLHILPEFAKVLVFHDILPVTPAQAHQLVLLYQNNIELPDSAELFTNLEIEIP